MPRSKSPTHPERLRAREREMQALEMRKAGYTYLQIGDKLGITKNGACRMVGRVLKRIVKTTDATAAEHVTMETARLDDLMTAVWLQAKQGDFHAIDRALRIMERRAKLLGLDAPSKKAIQATLEVDLGKVTVEERRLSVVSLVADPQIRAAMALVQEKIEASGGGNGGRKLIEAHAVDSDNSTDH